MNKVLVTGGAGFIGSNLSNFLNTAGFKVYVIDDLSSGNKRHIKNEVDLIVADVSSKKALSFTKKIKPHYIIHLAAHSNLSSSFKNPASDLERNFFPIVPLVKTAVDLKVKKFIFSSSGAVYGKSNKVPIGEDHKKEPDSPYGLSKLCSEYYLYFANQKFNLPYITLRFANVYGRNQNSDTEGGVVAIFLSNAIKGAPSTIFGNGDQTRDFIYVDDVVDAVVKSLNSNRVGEFNVGTSKEKSINDLTAIINQATGSKNIFNYDQNHDSGVLRNALSYSKIEKELSWKPKTKLEDGIKFTVEYFKKIS